MHKTLVYLVKKLISFKRQTLFLSLILLSIFLFPGMAVSAQSPDGEVNARPVPDEETGLVDLRGLTISDIERLYPMSAAAEAAIVHTVPLIPVIIDGVTYPPEGVSLFNGKRLRFIQGRDGKFYAFTTVEGLEQFMKQLSAEPKQSTIIDAIIETIFYLNWWYSGSSISIPPGQGRFVLPADFDNGISSVKVSDSASYAFLFDYPGLTGDQLVMESGSDHYMLTFEGWNDRASSIWVNP